jgi:hypothetical protein
MVELEEQKLLQKKIVQQRLVAYDTKLQLRQGLKKKIKPLTDDASTIPMSFFIMILEIESSLLPAFMRLC